MKKILELDSHPHIPEHIKHAVGFSEEWVVLLEEIMMRLAKTGPKAK